MLQIIAYKPIPMPLASLNYLININNFICLVYFGSINMGVQFDYGVYTNKSLPTSWNKIKINRTFSYMISM